MARKARTAAPETAPSSGLHVEMTPLTDLLAMAFAENPKKHDLPALVASYRRFGFQAPPMVDESSSTMVAGHGRCEALKLIKDAGEVPPDGVSLREDGEWLVPSLRGARFASDTERNAYVIADNQMTIHGGWDQDKLQSLLDSFRDDENGFEGLGFNAAELDNLLGEFEPPANENDNEPHDHQPPPDDEPQGDGPFVRHDITVETSYKCPKCSYEWSGKAK